MFKSTSKNHQKQLRLGDAGGGRGGGRGKPKPKTPATTCKKHPKHEQSPGVCAVCLRGKLTNLPASSSKITRGKNGLSSSTSSYLSSLQSQDYSSDVSSSSSPIYRRSISSMTAFSKRGNDKNNYDNSRSSNNNIVFSKSRSLAFHMQRPAKALDEHDGKKKQGFWSKLFRPKTRNKDDHHGTMKSRTLQENKRT